VSELKLPELGENVASGDVLRVLVKPGDTIEKDQPILELETDKATIEVPSSVAGQVQDVKVKPGEKVSVGQVILTISDTGSSDGRASEAQPVPDQPKASATPAAPPVMSAPFEKSAAGANTSAKIPEGEGLEQHVESEPRERAADKAAMKTISLEEGAPAPAVRDRKVVDISRGARPPSETPASARPLAPASPSVRRMARELGVDIDQVGGSGVGGRVSIDDVKAHAKQLVSNAGRASTPGVPVYSEPLPDFTRWGEIDRQPLRAVRRKTAEHLTVAWTTVPHVTQHDLADVTTLEELRKRYAGQAESAGGSLTVTAIAVKIVATALKAFPQFNSSIDLAAGEIVYKKYVHVGVAVDTDRGLLVPVIRDVDSKNIIQISVDLNQLSEKARNRKITLEEMQGGCFSVSNLGGIGGSFFTPIVHVPEVAILGVSRARMEPVYDKASGEFRPRLMLPLSLSYDHRVIDGADGARFLKWVVEAFEQPFVLALQG
jgi:pyruvate dehydrogenase E2 component (dihydrolipoamide acetyltransferase)